MSTSDYNILGEHRSIQLIRREDGTELYYSTHTNKTAIGIKGLARLLNCDPKTVSNALKTVEKSGEVNSIKTLEMPTHKGLRMVKLVLEDGLPKVLSELSGGKKATKTKLAAIALQEKFSQAGFRLGVMLEVAPEKVAKVAINKIKTPEQQNEVEQHLKQHAQYLDSFHSLGDELQANDCRYGIIHGYNNKMVGVKNGTRSQMTRSQKNQMTVMQIFEETRLSARNFKNGRHAENAAKKAGKIGLTQLKSLEGNHNDYD